MRRTSRARSPSTAASPGRRRPSTRSCSPRSRRASTRCGRASTFTTTTRSRSACSRRATSTSGCAGARSTKCWRTGAFKQFYMHRAGHWLGMDVHDAGLYQVKGASRKLAPGMVLTVEPGTYIRPADNVPERILGHRRSHRGRRPRHGDRHREPDAGGAEVGRRRRGGVPPVTGAVGDGRDPPARIAVAPASRDAPRCRHRRRRPRRVDAGAGARRRRRRRRRPRRARVRPDAARRPLARAVARRAPHPRAARRMERARRPCRARRRRSCASTFRRRAASGR